VLVVGAGPVGAVLALELARHDVRSIVVERSVSPSRHPKMDYVNGRSMELLRRLGLTEEIRTRGIAAEHTADFLWTLGFQEPPVAVWHHPSVTEMARRNAMRNDGSAPAEPYQRVQGSLLEDILRRAVREHPLVEVREGWTVTGMHQHPEGVNATVLDSTTGAGHTVRARYLAACDGAKSTARQCLDIGVDEAGPRTQHCSVYFRSGDPRLRKHGRAFVTIAAKGLTLVSRDEGDTWTGSLPLPGDEPFTADPFTLMRERLGVDFAVDEVLSVAQWEGSLAVADSYRRGAAFLAGDSAHQFFPTGGHGANTGIADAVDLGWKLAAVINGWGGPTLLASYELERRPRALLDREMLIRTLEARRRFGRLTAAGAAREFLAGVLQQESRLIDNVGVHFGGRYASSSVIWHERGTPPDLQWRRITPTTWPGGRAPAVRLADGSQLFDRLGPEFTLVDLTNDGAGRPLVAAADERGIPMKHLTITDAAVRACWDRPLVLVRPDHHIAWRGESAPDVWPAVLDLVSGHRIT
jgi:2-polyprenyl-6-methoxyphenol hydroxylase-like FAD-dependent oxidoreductase